MALLGKALGGEDCVATRVLLHAPAETKELIKRIAVKDSMNKDGCYTHVHMHAPRLADVFEDFCKDKLPPGDIYVPPQHQPINPEDEDDVVPDQHAAFGITKATQKTNEPAWKDLGLADLMSRGPGSAPVGGAGRGKKRNMAKRNANNTLPR